MKDGIKSGIYKYYDTKSLEGNYKVKYVNGEKDGDIIFDETSSESPNSDNNLKTEDTVNLDHKIDITVTIKKNFHSNYEDDYNVYSNEKLNSLIDEKGYIKKDIVIRGNEIQSLGKLKKVYGDLGIDSNSLTDLGELNYIKGDMWISNGNNLTTLGNLERVGGSISLKDSKIISLGKLWRVGDKLNLRDTDIDDISNLKKVKILFLPKRLKDVNIDFIETTKVKYWNDLRKNKTSPNPQVPKKETLYDIDRKNIFFARPVGFFYPALSKILNCLLL
jgi:hypothetical protein